MRNRFPILSQLTYLNSCSHGALSTDVREAYEQYLRDWEELGSPWELWGEKTEEARAVFAELVGAVPTDVAVTTSLSAGVSGLASGQSKWCDATVVAKFSFDLTAMTNLK